MVDARPRGGDLPQWEANHANQSASGRNSEPRPEPLPLRRVSGRFIFGVGPQSEVEAPQGPRAGG